MKSTSGSGEYVRHCGSTRDSEQYVTQGQYIRGLSGGQEALRWSLRALRCFNFHEDNDKQPCYLLLITLQVIIKM